VSIVGRSGVGKTTLIERLIPELNALGFRVGTVKHDVHGFEMDHPGKDSYRHKHAGAVTSIISSSTRIGMVKDVDHDHTLGELTSLFFADVDFVLAESYMREDWPKVEVLPEDDSPPLCSSDHGLIALVRRSPLENDKWQIRVFSPDDAVGLAAFLTSSLNLLTPDP